MMFSELSVDNFIGTGLLADFSLGKISELTVWIPNSGCVGDIHVFILSMFLIGASGVSFPTKLSSIECTKLLTSIKTLYIFLGISLNNLEIKYSHILIFPGIPLEVSLSIVNAWYT